MLFMRVFTVRSPGIYHWAFDIFQFTIEFNDGAVYIHGNLTTSFSGKLNNLYNKTFWTTIAESMFTYFYILKPTVNKWAQDSAVMEA